MTKLAPMLFCAAGLFAAAMVPARAACLDDVDALAGKSSINPTLPQAGGAASMGSARGKERAAGAERGRDRAASDGRPGGCFAARAKS